MPNSICTIVSIILVDKRISTPQFCVGISTTMSPT